MFPEVLCPPLPTWSNMDINSTDRSIGTVVKVSCSDAKQRDVVSSVQETACSSLGKWIPEVHPCSGT